MSIGLEGLDMGSYHGVVRNRLAAWLGPNPSFHKLPSLTNQHSPPTSCLGHELGSEYPSISGSSVGGSQRHLGNSSPKAIARSRSSPLQHSQGCIQDDNFPGYRPARVLLSPGGGRGDCQTCGLREQICDTLQVPQGGFQSRLCHSEAVIR